MKSQRKIFSQKFKPGFTFVEMVISFTLFSMLMTVVSSVFITVSKNYIFFSSYITELSNLRFVLERTSREVKEGYNYQVPASGQFTFINKDLQNVSYYLDANGRIYRSAQGIVLPITDERLRVQSFETILACPSGSGCQPVATFVLKLAPRTDAQPSYAFTLQFSVTQRLLAI